jgi:hypothetical protein
MQRRALLVFAAATLTLAACETATPYQPVGAHPSAEAGGYSETQIEAGRWRVTFAGNALTSRDTVERYLLYRSAELTLQQGFDWFAATDRATDKRTETFVDPYFGAYWGPRWGFYRRGYGWGWGRWGDPYWGAPLDVEQTSEFRASSEIVMGKGPKPADRSAFDAHSVVEHLGPTIIRPTAG